MERKVFRYGIINLNVLKQNSSFVGLLLLLFSFVFWVFFPSLSNDFQWAWDDQWMVLDHPMIVDQSMENIWHYFTHYDRGQYFPLNQLYYMVIFNLFGFKATAFHAGSLLLHLINVFLIFSLVHKIILMVGKNLGARDRVAFAGIVSIIFAIHPLQVESVAWISASKVLLYSTFTLGSLWSYVKYKSGKQSIYLILSFLGYILSLMVKEQAVILPLNILLLDFIFRTYKIHPMTRRDWVEKIPFFIVAFLFWYWSTLNDLGVLNAEWAYSWDQRLVFGSYSLVVYVIRFLIPTRLLFYYGYPIVAGEELPWPYYGYILVALFLLWYMIDLYRQRKYLPFFGLAFFMINILLVLHIIPMPRSMITADRYMYLSIVGLSVWLIWGLHCLYQLKWVRSTKKNKSFWRKMLTGILAVYLLACAVYSNFLTRKWNDSSTIKQELREFIDAGVIEKNEEL